MGQLWLSQLELGAQGDCEGPGPVSHLPACPRGFSLGAQTQSSVG